MLTDYPTQEAFEVACLFEDHLKEIALDWVREGAQAAKLGAAPAAAAGGTQSSMNWQKFLDDGQEFLAEGQAALIDLAGSINNEAMPAIDLTHAVMVG